MVLNLIFFGYFLKAGGGTGPQHGQDGRLEGVKRGAAGRDDAGGLRMLCSKLGFDIHQSFPNSSLCYIFNRRNLGKK
jgi:hypothetical protein